MKQFLLKFLAYSFFGLLVFNGLAYASLYFLGKSNFYKPEFVTNGVRQTKFDYLVLGSSTGLTTLDTKLLDSITHKSGLNISMDDSSMSSHFLMLHHFFSIGKKTKTLILAITPWDIANQNPSLNNNDYRFLPYVATNYVYDYYSSLEKNNFKPLAFSKYCPIIGVSYYNTEVFFPSLLAAIQPNKRNRFDDRGNYSYPSTGAPSEGKQEKINLEIKNPYFDKIKTLCDQNKVKLILYLSPMYKTTIVNTTNATIVDHSKLVTNPKMFYDNIHVNQLGREKCSTAMATFLTTKEGSL